MTSIQFDSATEAQLKALASRTGKPEDMLVREAVREYLETQEDVRRATRFQEAVTRGIQAVEEGKTVSYTPELLQNIKQEAVRKVANGEPYNSRDALPEDI